MSRAVAVCLSFVGCLSFVKAYANGRPSKSQTRKTKKGIKKIGKTFVCIIIIGIFAKRLKTDRETETTKNNYKPLKINQL